MSEEKAFPPTELKLRKLRRQGIVAVSEYVLSASIVCGFLLAQFIFADDIWSLLIDFSRERFQAEQGNAASFKDFAILLITLLGMLLGFCTALVLLVGALQTKFFFSSTAFFSRMRVPFGMPQWSGSRPLMPLLALLAWSLVFGIAFAGLIETISPNGVFLRGDIPYALVNGAFQTMFVAIAGFMVVLALISWFGTYFSFLREHRMTKSEMIAEIKEEEMKPEMKAKVRESFMAE